MSERPTMTDEQIKYMVDRFLQWKLPENFNPDGGISFKKTFNERAPWGPMKHEPVGTNLLDAIQTEAMVRYLVEGLPNREQTEPPREKGWLKPILEDVRADINARPDWQKKRVRTAEPLQLYGIEYCPTCGKQVRASDNRVLGPFYVWYHAGCLAEPAPPAAPADTRGLIPLNAAQLAEIKDWSAMPDDRWANKEVRRINLTTFARSILAHSELARLEAENAALREWKAAVLKVAKESDGETVTVRYKPDGESNTQKSVESSHGE